MKKCTSMKRMKANYIINTLKDYCEKRHLRGQGCEKCEFKAYKNGFSCIFLMHDKPREFPARYYKRIQHGEWNPHRYTFFDVDGIECSKCKKDVPYWTNQYDVPDFCPNCGEPMTARALEILRERYGNDI